MLDKLPPRGKLKIIFSLNYFNFLKKRRGE